MFFFCLNSKYSRNTNILLMQKCCVYNSNATGSTMSVLVNKLFTGMCTIIRNVFFSPPKMHTTHIYINFRKQSKHDSFFFSFSSLFDSNKILDSNCVFFFSFVSFYENLFFSPWNLAML